jgi:hypothetical protein
MELKTLSNSKHMKSIFLERLNNNNQKNSFNKLKKELKTSTPKR